MAGNPEITEHYAKYCITVPRTFVHGRILDTSSTLYGGGGLKLLFTLTSTQALSQKIKPGRPEGMFSHKIIRD